MGGKFATDKETCWSKAAPLKVHRRRAVNTEIRVVGRWPVGFECPPIFRDSVGYSYGYGRIKVSR